MALSELQKGFGSALLRRASPEGRLIAELQAVVGAGLLTTDVTVTAAQLKALNTPLQVLAAPGAAQFYDVAQIDALFVPGSDALSDPLLQTHNYATAVSMGDPAGRVYLNAFDAALLVGANLTGATTAYFNQVAGGAIGVALSALLGAPLFLSFILNGGPKSDETVSGNTAGDARLHLRLHYRLRNLDF